MSTRSQIVNLIAAGFLATMILPGCGGSSPTTSETAVAPAPQSEVEYLQQQEKLRKDAKAAKSNASKAAKK